VESDFLIAFRLCRIAAAVHDDAVDHDDWLKIPASEAPGCLHNLADEYRTSQKPHQELEEFVTILNRERELLNSELISEPNVRANSAAAAERVKRGKSTSC